MKVELVEQGKDKGPEIIVRAKVFENGSSDFIGLILGARSLDYVERDGLGFRPAAGGHVFDKFGIVMARTEHLPASEHYRDEAYRCMSVVGGEGPISCGSVVDSVLDELGELPASVLCGRCNADTTSERNWWSTTERVLCVACETALKKHPPSKAGPQVAPICGSRREISFI